MDSSLAATASRTPAVPFRSAARAALAVYLVVLTYMLLAPDPWAWLRRATGVTEAPSLPPYAVWIVHDKTHHVTAYALLAALLLGATEWSALAVLIAGTIHGGGMEILQHWFPPRSPDPLDWFADFCGVVVALLGYRLLPRRRPL